MPSFQLRDKVEGPVTVVTPDAEYEFTAGAAVEVDNGPLAADLRSVAAIEEVEAATATKKPEPKPLWDGADN